MSIDAYDDSDRPRAYHVETWDISIKSNPELADTIWHGDCFDKAMDAFEQECEGTADMVRKRLLEPGSTKVYLKEYDGTVIEERTI